MKYGIITSVLQWDKILVLFLVKHNKCTSLYSTYDSTSYEGTQPVMDGSVIFSAHKDLKLFEQTLNCCQKNTQILLSELRATNKTALFKRCLCVWDYWDHCVCVGGVRDFQLALTALL